MPAGAGHRSFGHERRRRFLPNHAIALDGETLVYDSYGCPVVEDFSTGLRRTLTLPATLDPVSQGHLVELPPMSLLQVAGHLLAYRANPPGGEGPASAVVYDIETGMVLYSVPLPPLPMFEDGYQLSVPTFALQADGTLLIASEPSPKTCQATVSTPANPRPRLARSPGVPDLRPERRTCPPRHAIRTRSDAGLDVAGRPMSSFT